jgi:hypothetical protein
MGTRLWQAAPEGHTALLGCRSTRARPTGRCCVVTAPILVATPSLITGGLLRKEVSRWTPLSYAGNTTSSCKHLIQTTCFFFFSLGLPSWVLSTSGPSQKRLSLRMLAVVAADTRLSHIPLASGSPGVTLNAKNSDLLRFLVWDGRDHYFH